MVLRGSLRIEFDKCLRSIQPSASSFSRLLYQVSLELSDIQSETNGYYLDTITQQCCLSHSHMTDCQNTVKTVVETVFSFFSLSNYSYQYKCLMAHSHDY